MRPTQQALRRAASLGKTTGTNRRDAKALNCRCAPHEGAPHRGSGAKMTVSVCCAKSTITVTRCVRSVRPRTMRNKASMRPLHYGRAWGLFGMDKAPSQGCAPVIQFVFNDGEVNPFVFNDGITSGNGGSRSSCGDCGGPFRRLSFIDRHDGGSRRSSGDCISTSCSLSDTNDQRALAG